MKYVFLSLLILVSSINLTAQLSWSSEVDVAVGMDNKRPRIVLSNGLPVVLWGQEMGLNGIVHVATWNGSTFNSPVQINPNGADAFVAWWAGPDIAAKDSVVYVVYDAQPEDSKSVYIVKSTDGGQTFGDTIAVDSPSDLTRFSAVTVDDNYNPLVIYMTHDSNWIQPEYSINRSNDGGQTWLGNTLVSGLTGSEVCDCCPPAILAGNGSVTAFFRNNDNNLRDYWISHSSDGGVSFPLQADIDNGDWTLGACPSSGGDIYNYSDTIIAVWMTGGSGNNRIKLGGYYANNGYIINAKDVSPNNSATVIQNYPRISGTDQNFGIAFQNTISGNHDVYFTYSQNGIGGLLDTTYRVNLDASGAQRNIDVAFDGVDTYHMVWQDDVSGNVKYRSVTVGPVGINESLLWDVQLYPNPSKGEIFLKTKLDKASFSLFSSDGKQVYSCSFSENKKIDVRFLPSGIYPYKIESSNGQIKTDKIVITQ